MIVPVDRWFERLLDLFTASDNLDLSESDECSAANNLERHDASPPHAEPEPGYGDQIPSEFYHQAAALKTLYIHCVCFPTFQEEISHSVKLDIQRTSSVMIMTKCN